MNKYVLFVFFLLASIRVSAQPETEGYVYFTKGQWATIIGSRDGSLTHSTGTYFLTISSDNQTKTEKINVNK